MRLVPCEQRTSYVYELVATDELPTVNLSKSLRSVLCEFRSNNSGRRVISSNGGVERAKNFLRKTSGLINAGFAVGVLLSIAMPWLAAENGRVVAVLASGLTLPSFVIMLSPVRYDIVLLLIKTYDFWYFMVVNTVSCILAGLYFNDARAIVMLMPWVGNLSTVLADANTMVVQHMIAASIPGVIVNAVLIACFQLRLIDAAKHFAVAKYGGRSASVEDVIANGLATHLLLLVRNMYRRTQSLKQQELRSTFESAALVPCVNYRCAVKLQLVRQPSVPSSAVQVFKRGGKLGPPRARSEVGSSRTQIVLVNEKCMFDAKNTFILIPINGIPWASWKRVTLRCVGILGIFLPIVARLGEWTLSQRRAIYGVAFVCTLIVCLVAWALSHKQLFWRIMLAFDYFFLSFQLTSLHACACDMVSWDLSCFGIFNSLLWMHLVLTADALTPIVRKKIGLSAKFLALPVLLFIVLQVELCYRLVVEGDTSIQDRLIFPVLIGRRRIEFRVVPFFFSRLATTFLWSFRLLWRIFHAKNDEVILLRGQVAYPRASQMQGIAPVANITAARVPGTMAT